LPRCQAAISWSQRTNVTREWWDRRERFELFVSQAVIEEAARGDVAAAARRAALLSAIPVLAFEAEVHDFANRLLRRRIVPAKASIDALLNAHWLSSCGTVGWYRSLWPGIRGWP
jgi:predicted nucleic acid-binding protein